MKMLGPSTPYTWLANENILVNSGRSTALKQAMSGLITLAPNIFNLPPAFSAQKIRKDSFCSLSRFCSSTILA